jgi:hypothetical protein
MGGGGPPALKPVSGASNWVQLGPMATPNGPPYSGNYRLDTGRVTAIVVDPTSPATIYLGAAKGGVWKTIDGGGTWSPMSDDEVSLDVGQFVALDDPQHHWMCADMKVDALLGNPLSFQYAASDVDFVIYESQLRHRNAERGNVNRVYVQVHNRGIKKAANVTVKLLFADASAKVPLLPNDFWPAFPGNSAVPNSPWHPIGAAKTVSVTPALPAVLEWDWPTPLGQATHSCLLVVVDSPDDPIPAAHKIFDVDALVKLDKRAGLKNLHVVDAPKPPKPAPPPIWSAALLDILGPPTNETTLSFDLLGGPDSTIGFFLPKDAPPLSLPERSALKVGPPTTSQLEAARRALGQSLAAYDTTRLYSATGTAQAATPPFAIPERGLRLAFVLGGTIGRDEMPPRFHVIQHLRSAIVGGSTFAGGAGVTRKGLFERTVELTGYRLA